MSEKKSAPIPSEFSAIAANYGKDVVVDPKLTMAMIRVAAEGDIEAISRLVDVLAAYVHHSNLSKSEMITVFANVIAYVLADVSDESFSVHFIDAVRQSALGCTGVKRALVQSCQLVDAQLDKEEASARARAARSSTRRRRT